MGMSENTKVSGLYPSYFFVVMSISIFGEFGKYFGLQFVFSKFTKMFDML